MLDGLIEGRLPDDPQAEAKLRQWVEFMDNMGVHFSLDAGGTAFSVLPDHQPFACAKLGPAPEDGLRQAVDQLVELLPMDLRGSVFSTLRSSEFRRNEEVQTVYAIGPDGKTRLQSRSVETKTTAPPKPLAMKERIKLAAVGLIVAALVVGVAFLFPPVREKFREMVGAATPVAAEDISVKAAGFEKYFSVQVKQVRGSRAVVVAIMRTEAYPKDDAARQAAYEAATTLIERLVIEALQRGRVRVELTDNEGETYLSAEQRISGLDSNESIEVAIPIQAGDKKRRLERVDFRY
jgi:hypothetical protein